MAERPMCAIVRQVILLIFKCYGPGSRSKELGCTKMVSDLFSELPAIVQNIGMCPGANPGVAIILGYVEEGNFVDPLKSR